MARTPLPGDVSSAITAHFDAAHPKEKPRIGKRGARRAAVNVHWRAEVPDEEEASFICHLCPDGWNRFYVNWDPAVVTDHTLRKIRRHFADQHGIEDLPLKSIWTAAH